MPNTTTPNYHLIKPEVGGDSDTWGNHFNFDMDAIDTALKAISDVANAALPSSGGSVSGSSTFQQEIVPLGGIQGVTDGSNPPNGAVGEFKSAAVDSNAPVNMPNNSVVNLVSLALSPGDWDVTGIFATINTGTPADGTVVVGGLSTVSGSMSSMVDPGGATVVRIALSPHAQVNGVQESYALGRMRVNVTQNTTVYLVGRAVNMSFGSIGGFGSITARRMR